MERSAENALSVVVDGAPMPAEDARALWARFSAYMESHHGDLAGFAAAEGFASIHPEVRGGKPVLVASRAAAQRPYATAPVVKQNPPTGGTGGSPTHRSGPGPSHRPPRTARKVPK
jgi:hypothetical protein